METKVVRGQDTWWKVLEGAWVVGCVGQSSGVARSVTPMISSSTTHKLKPSLSVCVTSGIPNLPGLELAHYSCNVEKTSLELVQLLFLDV